jgi:AcrR family transcriptional regulator
VTHGKTNSQDPRVLRSRTVVLAAALDELAERGHGGFTIDGVARRALVARSTVYRLWGDKHTLIGEAIDALNIQPRRRDLATETPRERIHTLLEHLASALQSSKVSSCLPALIDGAERDQTVRALLHGYSSARRSALVAALADARDDGSIGSHVDPERAADALAGAVFYRRLMTDAPLSVEQVNPLVESVLGPGPAAGRHRAFP